MDKYIGFDIAYKKTVACVVQKGKPDKYDTLPTDVNVMRLWLDKQRKPSDRLHLTFEVSGQSGWFYEGLGDCMDSLAPRNPSRTIRIFSSAENFRRVALLICFTTSFDFAINIESRFRPPAGKSSI